MEEEKNGDKKNIKNEIVTIALRRATTFFAALQSNQGHWPAENSGPLFYSPTMVFLFNPIYSLLGMI